MKKYFSFLLSALLLASSAFAADVGAPNTVYRMGNSGLRPAFGAVDLSKSAAVTNQLGAANGGTSLSSPGSAGNVLTSNGTTWTSSAPSSSSYGLTNLGLSASVSSSALTISLKQSDGSTDPASGGPVVIGFRKSTASSGGFTSRSVTSSLSVTVPSGTTIGTSNGVATYVYVYALDNAGTIVLGASLWGGFDNGSLQSSTAISGGSSGATLYTSASQTSLPVRLIGRINISESTAGTWATGPTEVSVPPFPIQGPRSEILYYSPNGYGSTNSDVRYFTVLDHNDGTAFTGSTSSTLGTSVTVNEDGVYAITYSGEVAPGSSMYPVITLNSTHLTNASFPASEVIAETGAGTSGNHSAVNVTLKLRAGDVLRCQTVAGQYGTTTANGVITQFRVVKVSN